MAMTCRVFEAQAGRIEAIPGGIRERRTCVFVGDAGELAVPDITEIVVEFMGGDAPGVARNRLVDAVMAEAARLGYSVARGRVMFPEMGRGN